MPDSRLDSALAARGLARSRTHAAKLIADGLVTVVGVAVPKASTPVTDSHEISIAETDHYVSRAAHKLIGALDAFDVKVTDKLALDVGASTGGFTQVLLERGAREVIALDVGHGQIVELIRCDKRVRVIERENARYLTAGSLAELSGTSEAPTLVVSDLSFISLRTVLPALHSAAADGADYVLLVKPQFEVGRTNIREGIVHQPALRDEAVMNVLWAGWDLGLGTAGVISSPIAGNAGNREYLVWLSARSGTNPTEWTEQVSTVTKA